MLKTIIHGLAGIGAMLYVCLSCEENSNSPAAADGDADADSDTDADTDTGTDADTDTDLITSDVLSGRCM